jgi:hypothetical protein
LSPIPVKTDHFSAQVIWRGKTGSSEDVYTNTFYFKNDNIPSSPDSVADQLAGDLEEFYNDAPTTIASPVSIASGFSSQTIENEAEVRVYDLGQPAPRYPKIRSFVATVPNNTPLPSEVAACLSYVSVQNQPRQRGRIYLGPLGTGALEASEGRAVVKVGWRHSVLAAAERLRNKPQFQWVLWSPSDNEMKEITGTWMDNAFDTQHRRGERATQRVTAGFYQGQSGTPVPFL